jgi:hypothetical protein
MKRFAWLVIVLAACGGDDRVDDFIGTWTYKAGSTAMIDCDNNQLDMTEQETDTFQFAAGTSSDLIEVAETSDACPPVRLDVSGSTASAQAGQSCTTTLGVAPNIVTVTSSLTTYTATLDAAGTKITLQARASSMFTGPITATCTATITGSAMLTSARTAGDPRVLLFDSLVRRLR